MGAFMRIFGRLVLGCLFSLILVLPSLAQTPGIDGFGAGGGFDGQRWSSSFLPNGGVALSQSQGFSLGSPLNLTWGFAADGDTFIPNFGQGQGANSNLIARLDQIYGTSGGSDLTQRSWFSNFHSVFDRWSSISGLTFIYEANDDGADFSNSNSSATQGVWGTRADVRIGGRPIDGNSGVLAFNFFPNVGDMVIDTNDNFFNNTTNNSIRLRNVLSHEIGHGIGMQHLFTSQSDVNALMNPFINTTFDGPQYHDILIAQRAYGDALEKGAGNDTFGNATSLGLIADGDNVSIGDSARTFAVTADNTDFISIDGQSDIDFFSFSISTAGSVNILLEALGFSYLTQPQGTGGGPTGNNVLFNTAERSDLALALFDTDGTTLLALEDANGLGGSEAINDFFLADAGTYFVRVTGLDNPDSTTIKTQFYGLSIGFTAIPEPSFGGLLMFGAALTLLRRRRECQKH